MNYFTLNDLELLKRLSGKKYNKNNNESVAKYASLQPLYEKVEYWARLLQKKVFPSGEARAIKRPSNQGQVFESYHWAKVWPDQQTYKYNHLAFTVAVTKDGVYELKFDVIQRHKVPQDVLEKYDLLRGKFWNSTIVERFQYESISNWDDLIAESIIWIKKVISIYDGFYSYLTEDEGPNHFGVIASIGWNSSGWKSKPSDDDLKHAKSYGWVNENGMMGESLNFAIDSHSKSDYIGLSPSFNKTPTFKEKINIVFMISSKPGGSRMIVGCYAFPEIGSFKRDIFEEPIYEHGNIKALTSDIVHLDNYLAVNEHDFLKVGQKLSKMSFTYLDRKRTLNLLFLLLQQNPELEKLRLIIHKVISTTDRILINPMKLNKPNLNTILYGPPGTGKTYETIDYSLKIVAPMEYANIISNNLSAADQRSEIKDLFNLYVDLGRIAFSTFHQSLGYEDFIEGIKPAVEEYGDTTLVTYRIEDGIFKRLANKASYSMLVASRPTNHDLVNENSDFDLRWDTMLADFGEALDSQDDIELQTRFGTVNLVAISDKGNLIFQHGQKGARTYTVSYNRLRQLYQGIHLKIQLDAIKNVNQTIRSIIGGCNTTAYYATLDMLLGTEIDQLGDNEISSKKINYLEQKDALAKGGYQFLLRQEAAVSCDNYVLIIDEISRGNVSQIFGELITNLESDKRIGRIESLGIILPYSKEQFFVPENLHIIGTMNTADRSIEALDVALRRRFEFKEISPKKDLLNGLIIAETIDIKSLFVVLNKRVVALLGKDHEIGHAYFLEVDSIGKLKVVIANKIIPLLQEYFFSDYGKIGLIMGEGFVESNINDDLSGIQKIFAQFYNYEVADFTGDELYYIRDILNMDDAIFIKAIKTMMGIL